MSALLPKTAPFSSEEIDTLNRLVAGSSSLQRSWLSGFLAGVDAAHGVVAQPAAPARPRETLTILFGSETGNSEALAFKARKAAQKLGFDARVLDMADASPDRLAKMKNLLVIVATWGEGDPPQRAAAFTKALMAKSAPRLDGVRFAVLALGDTAYANFCATGRAMDARLAELGATRVADRADLDLDFGKKAAAWTDATLAALAPAQDAPAPPSARVVHVDFKTGAHVEDVEEPVFDAERPLAAKISEIVNLNGTGSTAETWHIEFSTDANGWSYAPGDAIGVIPENDPKLIAELLDTVGLAGDAALQRELLTGRDVTTLTRPLVEAYAKLTGRSDVAALAAPEQFGAYAAGRQVIDLFADHREKLSADQLVNLLRPLPPRLYSVASSLAAHPGETHLLVGAVRWQSHGRERHGVASTWLSGRKPGDTVNLHVRPNRHFRLPQDNARPIVMIGAGTGLAPFRAFIEERAAAGATGKSWLIFGARNFTTDFLYQLEWQDHLASGALTRIELAFSRDQPEKIYVQHRLHEHADALRGWVDDGATVYVCGDEKTMARDVDKALADILGEQSLEELRRASRYLRDVY
ncbi:MAG: sulfite reductase subunit alpha [Hyphomicrobiaceae bacterium]|nr:MAG: sulfite reductase subunit alpha [Hyphomicrobiaceae bacterium]